MAYAGRDNVTKEVCLYVKRNKAVSNFILQEEINKRFGKSYAESTIASIKAGKYDEKFELNNMNSKIERRNYYYPKEIGYESKEKHTAKPVQTIKDDGREKKVKTTANYVIGVICGIFAVYGIFHGALSNVGSLIVVIILLAVAWKNLF